MAIVTSTTSTPTNNKDNCYRSTWKHWWQSWILLKHPLLKISVRDYGATINWAAWDDKLLDWWFRRVSQHEFSLVEVDVDELYSIRVIQYMTFISIIILAYRLLSRFGVWETAPSVQIFVISWCRKLACSSTMIPGSNCRRCSGIMWLSLAAFNNFAFWGHWREAVKLVKWGPLQTGRF
jgi:hypothetical protein